VTLPEKVFFRIGEVSGLVGVEPHVLRYWEREFRTIRPSKSAKGQRVYSRRDVENLLRVKDLLYAQGFTIAGARRRLKTVDGATAALPGVEAPRAAAGSQPAPPVASAALGHRASIGASSPRVRDQLIALRAELVAFLDELGG
jgi:DNA-binding transcriptional MerR regulator